MKVCERCEAEYDGKDGDNECRDCEEGRIKRAKANRLRRERHAMLTGLGLKCVKGALGGVYYE